MPNKPWTMRDAQRQGYQGWRPGNAVEALQGPPYGGGGLTRALSIPFDPSTLQEGEQTQSNVEVRWISQTFQNASAEAIIQALPNRVILIVQNLSPTNAGAVNFDQTAIVSGTTPNYVSQGLLLLPGVSLFIDKWCPTGTIHIAASNAPTVVVQGYSAIGNVPFIET